jgi:hypothetical protein
MPASNNNNTTHSPIPLLYRIWFHYLEPLCALNGAYLAYFQPSTYLHMTSFPSPSPTSATPPPPASTLHVSTHVAALYLFFTLAEILVTRSTNDRKVWKALFWSMLGSDLGYLVACWEVGGEGGEWVKPWMWDAVGWGNYGTTWLAFGIRLAFLGGIGL